MRKKRIVILGAGISGLSLAYYLSSRSDLYEITLLEKKSRPGGWIETDASMGYFFENGPRTFLASKSLPLLSLIKELGLDSEIILSEKTAKGRFLWIDGKLKKTPIFSLGLIKGVLREWRVPQSDLQDETVWDFACRRFNEEVALHFFDPLCIGIHAGDASFLSIRCCFPTFKSWEKVYGSLTKGFFKAPRFKGSYLFTLKRGVSTLISTLIEKSRATVFYDQEVKKLSFSKQGVEIETAQNIFHADDCFSALPCSIVGGLIAPELLQIPLTGVTVVNLGYCKNVLRQKGFGYIVSSKERDEVLGVIFNSNAFPEQNRDKQETRLTVKLRRTDLKNQEAVNIALFGLKKHLGIQIEPEMAKVSLAKEAFPQMGVGYREWIERVEKELQQKYPRLKLVGNYLRGVGVSDCVARAKSVADNFLSAKLS